MAVELEIVGGGRMGAAVLGGLLRAGRDAASLAVVEVDAARRGQLAADHPGVDVRAEPGPADSAVVAVKPQDAEGACRAVAAAGTHRVLSIAAGVTLARLEAALGPDVVVLRAMPNTPALVGAGVTALAAGTRAGPADLDWAEETLSAVGVVVRLPESQLDAVTGLSGSGPAYVFLVAEALIEAGVLVGLPYEVSRTLAVETLLGSARLLAESGDPPQALRTAVTSPAGTTAAGLRELERGGVRAAVLDAVEAAVARARELGG